MIVGLTGGIGAGKSAVARLFEERGAAVIDTDAIAREVVEPPSPVLAAIASEFGSSALRPDGHLDREAIAKIVFADESKRRRLNELTHPEILKRVLARIGSYPRSAIVLVVVPLLFESGFDKNCDIVVAVIAPEELRLRRVIARDQLSEADARARLRAQLPDAEYERRAGVVIRNVGDEIDLRNQLDEAWPRIVHASA